MSNGTPASSINEAQQLLEERSRRLLRPQSIPQLRPESRESSAVGPWVATAES